LQHSFSKSFSRFLLLSSGLFLLAGCAVSLGPGYTIQKQTLEVRFVPSPEPHLAVHSTYQLVNSGNQPLESLRVAVPSAQAFHRASISARWNDRTIAPQEVGTASSSEYGDTAELRFPESWQPKQKRTLILEYNLSSGSHLGSYLAVSPYTFFAYPESWNPSLLPPKGIFGAGGVPPKKWTISVRVPSGFLVHASGAIGKRATSDGDWIYSFTQQPHGFAPFVAGGQYVETKIDSSGRDVRFWMHKPVELGVAQNTAASVSTRARYYATEYGTPASGARAIRFLECVIPAQNFGCGALPETILVDQAWVARGLAEQKFYDDANFALAYTWFGGMARVAFDQYPLPMDALAPYAGWEAQAVEDGGGGARAERIRSLIADFDKHAATCQEKIVLPLAAGTGGCTYSAAWTKSGLFFFALEDKIGCSPLHRALKSMLADRRGRDIALEDLIAAMDAESREPLGPSVRQWLKHPGIPEEFRARYSMPVAPVANSEINAPKEPHP
jgi:hypothetical protein